MKNCYRKTMTNNLFAKNIGAIKSFYFKYGIWTLNKIVAILNEVSYGCL